MASIVVAALVSAVVALGIEWVAKPQLEVRKERVLRLHRARDDVWRHLNDILWKAAALKVRTPSGPQSDTQVPHDGVVPVTQALEDTLREEMPFNREDVAEVLGIYVGFVRDVMASERAWQEKGDLIFTWTPPLMNVLGGPSRGPLQWIRWRFRARRLGILRTFLEVWRFSEVDRARAARDGQLD